MGKKKKEIIRIAQLSDISIDDIVEAHIKFVTTPYTKVVNYEEITCDSNCAEPRLEIIKKAKVAPRKVILYHKYIFLIHLIIVRSRASKKKEIHLEYKLLNKVLGDCYSDMLHVLDDLHIIYLGDAYKIGIQSRDIILINWNIVFLELKNVKVLEYINRYGKLKNENEQIYQTNINNNEFTYKYNESLLCFDLTKKDDAIKYINIRTFDSQHSYHHYLSRIEDFDKKELKIVSIDNNNRIYHYFTNLPKTLKPYFNIKYQLDISNSHPLLFSLYLIRHYNIDNELLINLYNISIDNFNNNKHICYHNVSKQLRNMLNIKEIGVPFDVLKYIYKTSKGVFWDDFTTMFKDLNRGEVKAALFKEVFYSYSTTTKNKNYAKSFVKEYPHVWSVIRNMKKGDKLPNLMMTLDSRLF